jgi:hypothetical protein
MASSAGGESPTKPKLVLLHGDLDLWIIKVRLLPNMDRFSEQVRRCFAPAPATSYGPKHSPVAASTRGAGGRRHHRIGGAEEAVAALEISAPPRQPSEEEGGEGGGTCGAGRCNTLILLNFVFIKTC